MNQTLYDRLSVTLSDIETDAYQRGYRDALEVAETIAGWLTWQPQTKRMATVETWAREHIAQARKLCLNEEPINKETEDGK